MRIGLVKGRVCLSQSYDTLVGGRFLIVDVQDRFALFIQENNRHVAPVGKTVANLRIPVP